VPSLRLALARVTTRGREGEVTSESEGRNVFWILAITASTLLVLGWFLPWLVTPTSSGVGFSAQDVVTSGPTSLGSILTYVLAAALLLVVVPTAADGADVLARAVERLWKTEHLRSTAALRATRISIVVALIMLLPITIVIWLLARLSRFLRTRIDERLDRVRVIAALAGLALAIIIWLLARVIQEEPLFGPVDNHTITDSAVWLTWIGYIIAAFVFNARHWVYSHPNIALGIVLFPFGLLLPLIFHQAPDVLYWAAASLAIYTLLALGLNVVVGFAGLLDLGYAAFFAIGAYTCASLASPKHSIHLPLWVLIFLGAAVASLFGGLLGAPTLRLRGDYLAIVTLGFGEIIPDIATNNVGNLTGGPNGISSIDQPVILGINFGVEKQYYYWSLLVLVVIVVMLLRNLERSRVGRAWVALREDEVAAAATGINTTSTKLLAFAIGASVSGLAGAFYGSIVTIVSPDDFNFSVSVSVLSIVVLGGIGNITGVIVGSFVLTFVIFWVLPHLSEWSITVGQTINVPALGNIDYSQYTYIVYGVALILMMLLRPGGLLPSRARRIELQSSSGEEESLAAVQGIA
jgi:branched-chain amino acid transport system permease protein